MTSDTKKGAVTIRPTREADAEAYRELRLEALRMVPTAFGSDVAGTAQLSLDHWRERLRGGDHLFNMVAEVAGELVGMTLFRRDQGAKVQHQGYVNSVYIRPAWRGLGLIDALFAMGMDWAHHNTLRIVKLSVTSTNTSAIRAYTRLGFQVYGVEPDVLLHEGVYYDELLMYRRIDGERVT